jgi:uncharacterized protein (DUF305 family)
MNNTMIAIIGLVIGVIIGAGGVMVMNQDKSGMQMQMNDMATSLEGKTGDEFDKAFLNEMIMHHEGAVVMAQMARQHAQHQEIKDMAEDIITAQTGEIDQMKAWQKVWYETEMHHAE